jgi:cytochrome c oxidase subunit 3
MSGGDVKHDYHLVNPSAWPLLGSLAVMTLAIGAVTFMKGLFGMPEGTWWLMAIGFAMVFWVMFGWWATVVKEGRTGDHTPVVEIGLRYGMILFIVSEIMFFVAWFWGFFEFSIFSDARVGGTWDAANPIFQEGLERFKQFPPDGVTTFDPFHLPLMNTLVLLLSGTTVTWAHHALIGGDRKGAKLGLLITVLLGVLFTGVQAYEYYHILHGHLFFSEDAAQAKLYGSIFFMTTGFHGFHVAVGTIFLAVCLLRLQVGQMSPQKHFGLEAAAWYWHFVDVVWLGLFIFVYVL